MENTSTTNLELSHFEENELIIRTQKGDTEAFNPIISKYRKKIYNVIYQQVRDRETTEDICQEIF